MVRLDMSEYQERHTVSRPLGAPRIRGLRRRWRSPEAVRRKPYSVVLFDEIEGAPGCLGTLPQVLDDGASPTRRAGPSLPQR
jgi:ATP-dependent Clp protease ATP-binding subunit ClpA